MVDYALKDKVALITGANNPQGIGAATAFAFAREGAKVALVYKKVFRPFDKNKTDKNGVDRYYQANAESADAVAGKLKEMKADYMILENDISEEKNVKEIYRAVLERFGRVDILVNNAAVDDENQLNTLRKKLLRDRRERISSGNEAASPDVITAYADILNNFERIGDYALRVDENILGLHADDIKTTEHAHFMEAI